MSIKKRPVKVLEVADELPARTMYSLPNLCDYAEGERPRLVLDCSKVAHMNRATICLLLACLEEVMKHNGDVRLAALHPHASATLRLAGASRLFEIYGTTESAVASFHQRPASIARVAEQEETAGQGAEFAA